MLGWECMFYHVELQVILSVYVDDFKMAGKQENMSKAWNSWTKLGLNFTHHNHLVITLVVVKSQLH